VSLVEPLNEAIRADDTRRVRDLVVSAPEKERRAAAKEVEGLLFVGDYSVRNAARLAFVGTATARRVSRWAWAVGAAGGEEVVYEVVAARGRGFVEALARAMARQEATPFWRLVRRAVREGLIERPDAEGYTRGMVSSVGEWNIRSVARIYRGLLADEELLEDEVWRIFEVDCGRELRFAAPYEAGERGMRWGANSWTHALRRLSEEGRLDRQRLLDASLDALMRDFRASFVGSYVRLHEELEPSPEERLARIDRYLALLTSPTPAVVKAGLAGLKATGDAVPPDQLARAATSALAHNQKNLATQTLALLARAAERSPEARPSLLEAAAHGVAHDRADVQERALALVERYAGDAEATAPTRAVLMGFGDAVAPTLRDRLEALTGFSVQREPARVEPLPRTEPRRTRPTIEEALRSRPQLEPVESVADLIELAAALLEGEGDGDDAERFLEGVSRLCGERPPERLTAGLVKQAMVGQWWYAGGGLLGTSVVGAVVRAWTRGSDPRLGVPPGMAIGFLLQRAVEVGERARHRRPQPLLSFPTHSGGWLDPAVLAERERARGRFRALQPSADRAQAHLRAQAFVLSLGEPVLERSNRSGYKTARLVHRPPADLDALASVRAAVAALGDARPEGFYGTGPPAWSADDRLGASWCLTIVPSLPELALASAASACVSFIDADRVYRHPEVALQHTLDPTVPLAPVAWLALAAGLLGRAEDVRRPATDLLVQAVEDGRFDAEGLGARLGWLLGQEIGKAPRLAAPLRDAGSVSPSHAAAMLATVEGMLGSMQETPRNLHSVLEVALELAARTGTRVTLRAARVTLERVSAQVSRSSKLGTVARRLLEP
jgi:Family of unknown function (DUF6493)